MGDQALADMFDGGVSSVLSSFDATASQPAQNGAGTGTVNPATVVNRLFWT